MCIQSESLRHRLGWLLSIVSQSSLCLAILRRGIRLVFFFSCILFADSFKAALFTTYTHTVRNCLVAVFHMIAELTTINLLVAISRNFVLVTRDNAEQPACLRCRKGY